MHVGGWWNEGDNGVECVDAGTGCEVLCRNYSD